MIKKLLLLSSLAIAQVYAQSAPTFIYSHGLFDNHTQAYWFTKNTPQGIENQRYIMDGEIITFDYEDVTQWPWRTDFTQVSMAQTNEIMRMKKVFDATLELLKEDQDNQKENNIILTGVSRGASVIINFMGLFNPEPVKAIVVEAPFDSSATIAKSMVKNLKLSWIPGMHNMSHNILSFLFVQHKKDGVQPIDSAALIKKDLPIFMACSLTDWTVPASSTIALYKKLIETGHKHVYLFVAEKSKHAKIIYSDDGERYTQTIHAFYKKYGFAHDAQMALRGQKNLAQCQPRISTLQKYLK